MKIIKIICVFLLLASCLTAKKQTKVDKKIEQPNIVYIICDDLGYGDIQFLNPEKGKILTPKVDQLAKEAMSFTDAHTSSSVCTPSRYSILTGRYAWRTKLQKGVLSGGDELEPLIAKDRLTVPVLLKGVGYNTAAIGKWHLGFKFVDDHGKALQIYDDKKVIGPPIGATVPDGPITRGFDSYIGFHHSRVMKTIIENDKVIAKMAPVKMLQFLADHTERYIEKAANKKEPFFLYLALNSPHSPVVPSEKWQGKSGMGAYADFVMETDDVVGRVLSALKKNDIEDNTIVFFTSDNGCSYPASKAQKLEDKYGHFVSGDFRGAKSDIWEGGHRVPFIVKWPGKIEANSTSDQLICLSNLMATCADVVGVDIPQTAGEDSYSILPILKDKNAKSDHEFVIHHSIHGKFSVRNSEWKLEFTPGSGGWSRPNDKNARKKGLPKIQLYNMKKDKEETTNLYKSEPLVVKGLTAKLQEIVNNGRSTLGENQENDVEIDIFKEGL
ncbi:arylsulfatase [Flavicella sp.]|uniref:sulfatase family protein n=1 Tax=Flavicella sp. TaxID=2957742 RepID=UPI003018A5ED